MTPTFSTTMRPWFASLYLQRWWRVSCTNLKCLSSVHWQSTQKLILKYGLNVSFIPLPYPATWKNHLPSRPSKFGEEVVGVWGERKEDKKVLIFWLCRIWVISQKSLESMTLCGMEPQILESCCTSSLTLPCLCCHLGPQCPSSRKCMKSHCFWSKWYREGDRRLSHPTQVPAGRKESLPWFCSFCILRYILFSAYLTFFVEFITCAFSEMHYWIFVLINPAGYKWLVVLSF